MTKRSSGGHYRTTDGNWGSFEAPPDPCSVDDNAPTALEALFVLHLGTRCPSPDEARALMLRLRIDDAVSNYAANKRKAAMIDPCQMPESLSTQYGAAGVARRPAAHETGGPS